jgi:hypothetical protein
VDADFNIIGVEQVAAWQGGVSPAGANSVNTSAC